MPFHIWDLSICKFWYLQGVLKQISPWDDCLIKLSKDTDKGRFLKAAREKKTYIHESTMRLWADFSTETYQVKKEWEHISKILKEKITNISILHSKDVSQKQRRNKDFSELTNVEGDDYH